MSNLEYLTREIESITKKLNEKYKMKEEIQLLSKEAQRLCGEAVSLTHRKMINEALEKIKSAEKIFEKVWKNLQTNLDLIRNTLTAFQEYVEARALIQIVTENKIPLISELKVPEQSYALGLADLIGELRRRTIDLLREDAITDAEKTLELMEKIYVLLQQLEYPKSLVPGLRGKLDAMRRLIEDTRRLVVYSIISIKLRRALEKASK
ncbi:MAG: haloacid dehalogenase [archaeon GB-1867-035]|nr:haloacid dehalogenase [Candidatus Culexmicrobium profundum]